MKELVKTISYSQGEILRNILELHVPRKRFDCDPTYSKGNFYNEIPEPVWKYDIDPQFDDVVMADCRDLPLKSGSIESLLFDPPFLATTGPSLKKKDSSNAINKRFTVFRNMGELLEFYDNSLQEFRRVLAMKGILVFKCQDVVSSGQQYWSHVYVHNLAMENGFYALDLFVLLAKNRIVADWQRRNQKHARKYHSYFWVFRRDM